MRDSRELQEILENANSLREFVESVDPCDLEIEELDPDLIQALWDRDVPLQRAQEILLAERERLADRGRATLSKESRAPRYMDINDLDLVSHYELTHILAEILRRVNGDAMVTDHPGNQGVDVIWSRDNDTIGILVEVSEIEESVGTDAIQDVYTRADVHETKYSIETLAVVTTSYFSSDTKEAAEKSDVILFDRSDLEGWLSEAKLDAETIGTLLDEI